MCGVVDADRALQDAGETALKLSSVPTLHGKPHLVKDDFAVAAIDAMKNFFLIQVTDLSVRDGEFIETPAGHADSLYDFEIPRLKKYRVDGVILLTDFVVNDAFLQIKRDRPVNKAVSSFHRSSFA